jgi:hypothetical protein
VEHDHEHDEEEPPDMSEWLASANTTICPACGASGALTLGGGVFCPACGEVTPGYGPPSG